MSGAPARVRTVFPAQLDAWTGCARRYRWRYLEDPPKPRRGAWAHTSMGAAVHAALAEWWRVPANQRSPGVVAQLVAEYWSSAGFADEAMSRRWLGRAQQVVADYVRAESGRRAVLEAADLAEPRRVETVLSLRVRDDLVVSGRPDRVDERPVPGRPGETELVVVDYKTGRRALHADDARSSRTLAIYAAAAQAVLRRRSTRVELHHVTTGHVLVAEHDESSRDRHVRRAVGVADDIARAEQEARSGRDADAVFPPSPGPLCAWCDYRDSCPEGMEAGPAVASWEALEPNIGVVQQRGLDG